MKPNALTRYGVYYCYTHVPYADGDMPWHLYSTYDTLEEAEKWVAMERALDLEGNWECYYIIMEEVTEREIIYSDI